MNKEQKIRFSLLNNRNLSLCEVLNSIDLDYKCTEKTILN